MKPVIAFCCLLLTHCLSQAQKSPSPEKVCLSLLRDILNLVPSSNNGTPQGFREKNGPRGFPGPDNGKCTCDPRDVEELRSSLRKMESMKNTKMFCSNNVYPITF